MKFLSHLTKILCLFFIFQGIPQLHAQTQLGADIDGEAAGDQSGYSVSLSADGSRMAVGAPFNDGNGTAAGHVRIYDWDGSNWMQVGNDIDGEMSFDYSGWRSVSLSADGSRVAIGAYANDGNGSSSGHVRLYDWDGSNWLQVGSDIDGEAANDQSGQSVSLSADGSRVAIGAPTNGGFATGHVRIYDWDGTDWIQAGADIDGDTSIDLMGESVSLSADGSRVAVGAGSNNFNGINAAGYVSLYDWDGTDWVQVGTDIDGEASFDRSGTSVSLSADGSRVAIGAFGNDGNGSNSGHVRLYDWDGSNWMQVGNDIEGEAAGDQSGISVSLSADGSRVAIGATENGSFAGHVRLYDWDGSNWAQLIADIDGEAADDNSGRSVSLSADGSRVAIGANNNDGNGSNSGHVRVYGSLCNDSDSDGVCDSEDPCPTNANAFLDDCGTCVGGDTGLDPCASADLILTPSTSTPTQCDEFTVLVSVESADTYNTVEALLNFDPNELQVVEVTAPDGSNVLTSNPPFDSPNGLPEIDNTNGSLFFVAGATTDITGNIDFIRISFEVIGNGGTTSITPVTSGSPRSRVVSSGFVDGIADAIDILNDALPIDITLSPDTELPTFSCISNLLLPTNPGVCTYTVQGTEFDPFDVSDNCGIATIINNVNGTASLDGENLSDGDVITWTVTDVNGNSDQCQIFVTVIDNQAPTAICQDITVQLDASGAATIAASDINNGSTDNCGIDNFSLDVSSFTCANVGNNTVTLTVIDAAGNSDNCTANVLVEDNIAPVATCQNVIVQLDATGNGSTTAAAVNSGSTDACGIASLSLSQTDFTCTDVGANAVTLTVTDNNNNVSTCTATVTVEDNIAPEALCVGSFEIELNSFGSAVLDPSDIDNGSNDACGIASLSLDRTSFDCSDLASPAGAPLIITGVIDADLPGGLPKAIELYASQDIADLSIYGIGSANNGGGSDGEEFTLSGSATAGDYIYVAPESTLFSAFFGFAPNFIDGAANVNGDDAIELFVNGSVIDVFGDINTDGTGQPWEYADGWAYRVDETGPDGSTFASGNWTYSGPNALDGETTNASATTPFPIGTYSPPAAAATVVTLTVTDNNGNTSTCTSEITVVDGDGPQALCNIITIQLDEDGLASITVDDVDDGSFAPCGIADRSIDVSEFTCADIGPNDVVLTITDLNGVTASCTATVNVEDVTPPTAQCANITVQLDETGNATITANDIDNNSFDNCGIASRSIDISSFTCADVGNPVTVSLTVTDGAGLTSTCQSTVTVEDNVAPEAICASGVEVILDAGGNGTLTAAEVDGGSTDACGIASVSIDKTSFTCTDVSLPGGQPSFALIITGVIDGPLTGGTPKAVELYAAQDIADLSIYGISSANNGGGATGTPEFDLFGSATAGDYIYIASESAEFSNFFGFSPDFTNGAVGINGDDAIELFENGVVIDVFGDVNTDGTGEAWDYADGWAYRNSDSQPSGSTFDLASWTFSGIDALDGESDNATASTPFPIGTYGFQSLTTTDVILTVTDENGNSSTCTASVTVIDNTAPAAVCTTDEITVQLDASGNATLTAAQIDGGSTDNCGIASTSISPSSFTCTEVGIQTVTLTVTDQSGNESQCTKEVTVRDNIAPTAVCQDFTVQLDANGTGTLLSDDIDGGSTDNCAVESVSVLGCPENLAFDQNATSDILFGVGNDNGAFTLANNGSIELALRAKVRFPSPANTFNSNGDGSYNHAVGVFGTGGVQSGWNFEWSVNTDADGASGLKLDDLTYEIGIDFDPTDGVNFVEFDPINQPFADHAIGDNSTANGAGAVAGDASTYASLIAANNVAQNSWRNNFFGAFNGNVDGRYEVYLKAFDGGGNEVAMTTITVIAGNGTGNAYAGCLAPLESIDFDCTDVGVSAQTLLVRDASGNESTCTAQVTIVDAVAPVALCQNITVELDAAGNASIAAVDVDAGSTDACGIASLVVSPSSFTCAEVGPNTVTLTVTDTNGNVSTCSSTVTVADNVDPVAICQTITVFLDNTGNASITGADLDGGSSDACGIATLVPSISTFDCSNLGANSVDLTVTDNNGNMAMCTATVNVVDTVSPVITCPADITVSNDAGACGANVNWVVPAGSDNCSVASVVGDADSGDFFPTGTTTVNYTVTDGSGNTADCSFTVTVEDTEAPMISGCVGEVTVIVNQTNDTYLASLGEFDPSFTDNCTGATISHDAATQLNPQVGPNNTSLDGWEFPVGTTTITFTAIDVAGNTTDCVVIVTVENAVVTGTLVLNTLCLERDMKVTIYETGTAILAGTFNGVLIDSNGDFSFDATGIIPGNYDVYLKPEDYLTKVVEDVTIGSTPATISATAFAPGDIDAAEDDQINGNDLSLIIAAYNTEDGIDAAYNSEADINCDGFVDALDLSLLIFFFFDAGESPN